jgi:hypothetical protein
MKIIWAFGDDSTFTYNFYFMNIKKFFYHFVSFRKHSDSNRGINEAKFVSKVGAVDAGSNLTSDPNVITVLIENKRKILISNKNKIFIVRF